MALEFGLGSVEWAPWSGTSWLCLLLVGLIYVSYSYELRVKAHGKKVAAEGASPKAKSLEEPLIRAEQGYGATGPQAPAGGMVVTGIVLDADKVVEVMRVGVLCFWMVLCSMAIIYTNAWILTEGAAKASADDAAPRGGVLAALAAQEERASEKKKEAAQESDAEEAAAAADEAAPEAARQDDAQTAASQDDWQQYFDDDGNPYWFNPMTGESTYDQPGAQAEEWTQVYDDSGNVYWYNQATGASQYEDPYDQQQGAYDEGGGAMVQYDEYGQAVEPYYDQAQQYAEPDPNGDWAQYQDEAGNWYWYNQATGESTYDQPA